MLPVIFILLSVAVLLLLLLLFLLWPATRRHPDIRLMDRCYIAHRGLHDVPGISDAPENSLAAFRAAAEAGYMIETDIHVTLDGEVIVFHDDSFRRMCGVDRTPESMTLAQIRTLRLSGTEHAVPTLQECLNTVAGKVPLLIEFKCMNLHTCRRLCEAVAPLLDQYQGQYMVQSFFPYVLQWYRKHRKHVCRGQLAAGFYHDKFYMRLAGCLIFNVVSRPDFISYSHTTPRNIFRRLCTLLGAHPVCWTIHSPEEVQNARKYFRTFIFEGFIPRDL